MTQTFSGCDCVDILRFQNLVFIILMYGTFLCNQKTCSALHTTGTQHQCCCNSSTVCNTACCKNWNLNCVANLWNKSHGSQFADMSAGFSALCNNCSSTASFHQSCHCCGCNDRNHLNACFYPFLHIFSRVTCSGNNNRNFFCNNKVRYLVSKWAHQHDVDTKWFICHGSYLVDFLAEPVCICIHCCNDSQSSSIADCCCQRCVSNPCHASLKNRVSDI